MEAGGEAEGQAAAAAASASASLRYVLQPHRLMAEDILFCVDVGAESRTEMKVAAPAVGPVTRIESVRKSLIAFVYSKLQINPDHRFALATLSSSFSWVRKEFSNDLDATVTVLRQIKPSDSPHAAADLTQLIKVAMHEAKKSREQNRLLRVIFIYCRSSIMPQHQWPVSQKLFTLDVLYLHDKPSPDNCPQKVFDALTNVVDNLTEYEGFVLESGHGLSRSVFRLMYVLLSHPQQRCPQEALDVPKPLKRKSAPSSETTGAEESISIPSQ